MESFIKPKTKSQEKLLRLRRSDWTRKFKIVFKMLVKPRRGFSDVAVPFQTV